MCFICLIALLPGYPEMSRYLNESGRHIVFSCEWPMYESAQGGKVGVVSHSRLIISYILNDV